MSNVYATTPTNVIRADALAGVRTRRILAVCVDFVLVSLLVAALWIVSIVLTFGLALFFLPPLFPFVAFFYNGLTVSGAQHGDARHAGARSRNAHERHRARGFRSSTRRSRRCCSTSAGASRRSFWSRWSTREKRCLHDIIAGVVIVRRL